MLYEMEKTKKSNKLPEDSKLSHNPEEECEMKWRRWKAYLQGILYFLKKGKHSGKLVQAERNVIEKWSQCFFFEGGLLKQRSVADGNTALTPITSYLDCFRRISECHVRRDPTGGTTHLDFPETLLSATQGHIWPTAEDDVLEYLNLCFQCQGVAKFDACKAMSYKDDLPSCFSDPTSGPLLFSGKAVDVKEGRSTAVIRSPLAETPAQTSDHPAQTGPPSRRPPSTRVKSDRTHRTLQKTFTRAKQILMKAASGQKKKKRGRPKKESAGREDRTISARGSLGCAQEGMARGTMPEQEADEGIAPDEILPSEMAQEVTRLGRRRPAAKHATVEGEKVIPGSDQMIGETEVEQIEPTDFPPGKDVTTSAEDSGHGDFPLIYSHLCEICCALLSSSASLEYHLSRLHEIDIPQFPCNRMSRDPTGPIGSPLWPFFPCRTCGDRFWTAEGLTLHQEGLHRPPTGEEVPGLTTCPACRKGPEGDVMAHMTKHHVTVLDMFLAKFCAACTLRLSCPRSFEHHMLTVHGGFFSSGRQGLYRAIFSRIPVGAESSSSDLGEKIEVLKSIGPSTVFGTLFGESIGLADNPSPIPGDDPEGGSSLYVDLMGCPYCDCEFANAEELDRHVMRFHHFLCRECKKGVFTTLHALDKHFNFSHPNLEGRRFISGLEEQEELQRGEADPQDSGFKVGPVDWTPVGMRPRGKIPLYVENSAGEWVPVEEDKDPGLPTGECGSSD